MRYPIVQPKNQQMTQSNRRQPSSGFTRPEGFVLVALFGIVALFAVTSLRTLSRREGLLRNARDIQFLVKSARDLAIKRGRQVVVWIDMKGRRIVTWVDEVPNFVQDSSEPTVVEYRIPAEIFFRYAPGGTEVNGPSAVAFDG
jgi:Tfp pilus assembly protein FimT